MRRRPAGSPRHAFARGLRTLDRGDRRCRQRADREAQGHPPRQSPFERVDARDAPPLEQERHPGARGFVRSGAIEDELPIPRDAGEPFVDVCWPAI